MLKIVIRSLSREQLNEKKKKKNQLRLQKQKNVSFQSKRLFLGGDGTLANVS